MPAPGTLFLVVGPSGAGKDSLIDGARVRLAGDPAISFPARLITRAATAGAEAHRELAPAAFEAALAADALALHWRAHGLSYGIDRSIEDDLAAGRAVVVNVSRGVVEEARQRYQRCRVLHVTAPIEVLAARLAGRGRESPADIAARLARAAAAFPDGPDVVTIVNDGPLERGIARFVAAIRRGDMT